MTSPSQSDCLPKLNLTVLRETLAICRLGRTASVPSWVIDSPFYSVTGTNEELSIVCRENSVPKGVQCDKGWRCFKVDGPLDLSLTGVLVSLTGPLAQAGISVFAISTFDTDCLLVKKGELRRAAEILHRAGHRVIPSGRP
jgi:uncharacterized protein